MQAYTAVIGTYLVLLTLFGISRYRLIPGLEESVAYVEALGAITIMLPSFLQSLDGNWRYEMILLVEAAAFLTSGIALRRSGLLGASLFALMLVGGRVLFDAINAVPNWIVALIIGMALLLAGLAITLSRDRWTRWQEQIISWWGETQNVSARSRRLRS
jgi:membrane-bound ClpP family serine protease